MMNIDILSLPGVAAIRENFIIQLEERLARFETLCYVSMSDQDYAVALDEACAILHNLSGTAGTLGFPELGDKARLCEAAILSHQAGNGPSRQELLVSLAEFAEMADDLLEQHGR